MKDNKSYRINTNIKKDKVVNVQMSQDIDCLEILSLKINQVDTYRLQSANYGIIVGRVLANDGFGVPNVKVSVFIPLDDADKQNSDILSFYPYTSIQTRDKDGRRYNLLPDNENGNGDCYRIVGTFPNKRLVLDNDSQLDIYDKYWKYTTVTNNAGDYMLYGVPVGTWTVHIDCDLSDIGILSQKPRDMFYKGYEATNFDNSSQFKESTNLEDLKQILTQDKGVRVYPFWGDKDSADVIALSRCDMNIAYKFEPTCVFMGSIITDDFSNAISHKCTPSRNMGKNDTLTTNSGTIEMIRETIDGGVEEFQIQGNELIDGDGVWCYQIPMNLDYIKTDEYGNIVPTDNPNEGIPTRTSVRFRISTNETMNEGISRHRAKYLVPNNIEMKNDGGHRIKNQVEFESRFEYGSATTKQHFRSLYWNKIYSVKNYIPRLQTNWKVRHHNYTGIRSVNLGSTNNPHPFNRMRVSMSFMYMLMCGIFRTLFELYSSLNKLINGINEIIKVARNFKLKIGYISCVSFELPDENGVNQRYAPDCNKNGQSGAITNKNVLIDRMQQVLAEEYNMVNLDFYNDWINGSLYMPMWFWRKLPKRSYLWGLIKYKARNKYCGCDFISNNIRVFETCALNVDNTFKATQGKQKNPDEAKQYFKFGKGIIHEYTNKAGLNVYYYAPGVMSTDNFGYVQLFATDLILLGSFNQCDWDGMPNVVQYLPPTTANIPFLSTVNEPIDDNANAPTMQITGMDWTYEGKNRSYVQGLLLDIACTYTTTLTKSCYNLRRLCELGVSLDTDYDIEVPTREEGVVENVDIKADGLILKQEIDDNESRAIFATLNHNRLTASTQNEITTYNTHLLHYMYPQNFDGGLANFVGEVSTHIGYASKDGADDDYIKFRYGAYGNKISLGNINKYSNSFPIYNNSLYFYFGLRQGRTAIDKFRNLFDASCYTNTKFLFTVDISVTGSSVCNTNGDGVIELKFNNIKPPYSLSLLDEFNDEIQFTSKDNIYTRIIDDSVPVEMDNISYNNIMISGLTNQDYTLIVTDARNKSITESISLTANINTSSVNGVDLVKKYEPADTNKFTLSECGIIELYDFIIDGEKIPQHCLPQTVGFNTSNGKRVNSFDIQEQCSDTKIRCSIEYIPDDELSERNKDEFIYNMEDGIVRGEIKLSLTENAVGYKLYVTKNGKYVITYQLMCLENGEYIPKGDITYNQVIINNGNTFKLYVNGVDADVLAYYKLPPSGSTLGVNEERCLIENYYPMAMAYKYPSQELSISNVDTWENYVDNLELIHGVAASPYSAFLIPQEDDTYIPSLGEYSGVTNETYELELLIKDDNGNVTVNEDLFMQANKALSLFTEKVSNFVSNPIFYYFNEGDDINDYTQNLCAKLGSSFDYNVLVDYYVNSNVGAFLSTFNKAYNEYHDLIFGTCSVSDTNIDICWGYNNLVNKFVSIANELKNETTSDTQGDIETLNLILEVLVTICERLEKINTTIQGAYQSMELYDMVSKRTIKMGFYIDPIPWEGEVTTPPLKSSDTNITSTTGTPINPKGLNIETTNSIVYLDKVYLIKTENAKINAILNADIDGEENKYDNLDNYINNVLRVYAYNKTNPPQEILQRNGLNILRSQLANIFTMSKAAFVTSDGGNYFEFTTKGGKEPAIILSEAPIYEDFGIPEKSEKPTPPMVSHSVNTNIIEVPAGLANNVGFNYCTFHDPKNISYWAWGVINTLLFDGSYYSNGETNRPHPYFAANFVSAVDNNGTYSDKYAYKHAPQRQYAYGDFGRYNTEQVYINPRAVKNFVRTNFKDRALDYDIHIATALPKSMGIIGLLDYGEYRLENDNVTYKEWDFSNLKEPSYSQTIIDKGTGELYDILNKYEKTISGITQNISGNLHEEMEDLVGEVKEKFLNYQHPSSLEILQYFIALYRWAQKAKTNCCFTYENGPSELFNVLTPPDEVPSEWVEIADYQYKVWATQWMRGTIVGNIFNGIEMGYTYIDTDNILNIKYGEMVNMMNSVGDTSMKDGYYNDVQFYQNTTTDAKMINLVEPEYYVKLKELSEDYSNIIKNFTAYSDWYYNSYLQYNKKEEELKELKYPTKSEYSKIIATYTKLNTEKDTYSDIDVLNKDLRDVCNFQFKLYSIYQIDFANFEEIVRNNAQMYNFNVVSSGDTTDYQYSITYGSSVGYQDKDLYDKVVFDLKDTDKTGDKQIKQRYYSVQLELDDEKYELRNCIGTNTNTNGIEGSYPEEFYYLTDDKTTSTNYKAGYSDTVLTSETPSFTINTHHMFTRSNSYTTSSGYDLTKQYSTYFKNDESDIINIKDYTKSQRTWSYLARYVKYNDSTTTKQTLHYKPTPYALYGGDSAMDNVIRSIYISNVPYSSKIDLSIYGCSYNITPEVLNVNNEPRLTALAQMGEFCSIREDAGKFACVIKDYSYVKHKRIDGETGDTMNFGSTYEVNINFSLNGGENTYTLQPTYLDNINWYSDYRVAHCSSFGSTISASEVITQEEDENGLPIDKEKLYYKDYVLTSSGETGENCVTDSRLSEIEFKMKKSGTSDTVGVLFKRLEHDESDSFHLKMKTVYEIPFIVDTRSPFSKIELQNNGQTRIVYLNKDVISSMGLDSEEKILAAIDVESQTHTKSFNKDGAYVQISNIGPGRQKFCRIKHPRYNYYHTYSVI